MDAELERLHEKIDRLTEMVTAQHRRQAQIEDLARDAWPMANQAIRLATHELEEVGAVTLEDVLFLLKRVLRDTCLLAKLLNRAEAALGLMDEVEVLGKQVFTNAVEVLAQLERKGYFKLAQGGAQVVDRAVGELSETDLRALADNLPALLALFRAVNRPAGLALARQVVEAANAPPPAASLPALLKQLAAPQTRQGLARAVQVLQALGAAPADSPP